MRWRENRKGKKDATEKQQQQQKLETRTANVIKLGEGKEFSRMFRAKKKCTRKR